MEVRLTHNKTYITSMTDYEEEFVVRHLKIIYFHYKKNGQREYEKTVNLYNREERSFPTGFLITLADRLDKHNIDIEFVDERVYKRNTIHLPRLDPIDRRDHQDEAIAGMNVEPNGYLSIITAAGKSAWIRDGIDLLRVRTLVIAPTEAIRDELGKMLSYHFGEANVKTKFTESAFTLKEKRKIEMNRVKKARFIDINADIAPPNEDPEEEYLQQKGYIKTHRGHLKVMKALDGKSEKVVKYPPILILCPSSVRNLPIEYFLELEMMMVDEGHTGMIEDIRSAKLECPNLMYCYCISATAWRDRAQDMALLFSVFGNKIVFEEIPKVTIAKKIVKKPVFFFEHAPQPDSDLRTMKGTDDIRKRGIVGNKTRNQAIVNWTKDWLSLGRRIMICVGEAAHIPVLTKRLEAEGIEVFNYHGGRSKKDKKEMLLLTQTQTKPFVIISTTALTIGADTNKIDAVILTGGDKASIMNIQRPGRGGRWDPEVSEVWILDFFDWFHPTTMEWSRERQRVLKKYYEGDESFMQNMAKKHKLRHT